MIESALAYLASIAILAMVLGAMEKFSRHKVFTYLPAVVLIYGFAMVFAQLGLWDRTEQINETYTLAKRYLLPAMLFLMLIRIDLKHFVLLGRKLLIAYFSAVLSIAAAFVLVFWLLGFNKDAAGVFGALAGSWTGGTANMLAVASAMNVDESLMGYALVVDSIDYTLWVMLLLALVGAAPVFNKWIGADSPVMSALHPNPVSKKQNYFFLLALSFGVSAAAVSLSLELGGLSSTTWAVLISTLAGLLASRTRLGNLRGSTALSSAMLYLLVALIGSRASFSGFDTIPIYLFAGILILLLHAVAMIVIAKIFKLDLFSIGVASLANIGGVASAPILAAAYNRSLVGIAVLMAIMGYLIGTVAGLAIAAILKWIGQ